MHYVDVIHGEVELPDIIMKIIETPQFVRLKEIHQLGCVYKICKRAKLETRYSHCIGTYILATRMLNALENNSKLLIPEYYKRCVKIAALLHDVGHGPFSHLWERVGSFDHERNSSGCIDTIFENIKLSSNIQDHHNQTQLIKALIQGKSHMVNIDKKHLYIFEIVHNEQCGIDVDKWDYLKRDAYYVGEHIGDERMKQLSFEDLFYTAKISDDGCHILYNYKHYDKIYLLFEARQYFHMNIYHHPEVTIYENILLKALQLLYQNNIASSEFEGRNIFKITSRDVNAFLTLTDDNVIKILQNIRNNDIKFYVNCFLHGVFEKINSEDEQDKIDVPDHLIADIEVKYAGEELKNKEILFYGNQRDKPAINEKKGYFKKKVYFRMKLKSEYKCNNSRRF